MFAGPSEATGDRSKDSSRLRPNAYISHSHEWQKAGDRAAVCLGLAACVASPRGVQFAHLVEPQFANILFAVFIVAVAIQLIVKQLRSRPAAG